ncbi:hypothetical protein amrb99_62090 [Actinomadura sp. RB99]|uniref:hypothetical protein n=1 Tax=Actinomadura sp. RB99 TaxID=2691577 RepID=UPI001689AADE|nr:hypothetical protein [Actinomadura sp. RB99]MBD2897250.1 hypothetical protein [Actinomadura sp. RB99]
MTTTTAPAPTSARVAELLAADADAGHVTPDDVHRAEQEAADAAALVDALEGRVIDGDESVTADQISAQRDLSRFAELRAQATARKAKRAARAARLADCDALRAEIEAYATGTGARYVELLQAAEDAVAAFTAAVADRNARIGAWRARMAELGVPEHGNPLVPPAEHAHLGQLPGSGVIAGRRRLDTVDPGPWLGQMLARVAHAHTPVDGLTLRSRFAAGALPAAVIGAAPHPEVYDELGKVDAPVQDPPEDLRFFRTTGGAVLVLDHEPNEHEARGITAEITRREAWGQ